MKYRIILLVVVAALASAENNDGRTSFQGTTAESSLQSDFYRRLEGIIKVPFRSEENVTAENGNQCLHIALKRCRIGSRCAASFHPTSRTCVTSALFFDLLNLKESSSFIEQTPGEAWVTYDWLSNSLITDLPPPSGLWLFDSDSKGRNFGTEGRRIDASFINVKWTEEGPRGLPLKYPLLLSGSRSSYVTIQNRHNEKHLIDGLKPFTIAIWIKAIDDGISSGDSVFMLGEWGERYQAFLRILQGGSIGYFSLFPNQDNYYNSVYFPPRFNAWTHVAAVYNGPGNVQFYLNGDLLKVGEKPYLPDASVGNRDNIYLRNFYSRPSSVACLSFFQRPLSKAQVAHVMRKCP